MSPSADDGPRPRAYASRIINTRIIGVLFIVAQLLIWQLLATEGVVDTPSVPAVSEIVSVWGQLLADLSASLARVFIGFAVAVAVETVLGLGDGYSSLAFDLLERWQSCFALFPAPLTCRWPFFFWAWVEGLRHRLLLRIPDLAPAGLPRDQRR